LAIIDDTSCSINLILIGQAIPAANADAVLVACFSFSEALAIKFQAIDFGAFAANLRKLARR